MVRRCSQLSRSYRPAGQRAGSRSPAPYAARQPGTSITHRSAVFARHLLPCRFVIFGPTPLGTRRSPPYTRGCAANPVSVPAAGGGPTSWRSSLARTITIIPTSTVPGSWRFRRRPGTRQLAGARRCLCATIGSRSWNEWMTGSPVVLAAVSRAVDQHGDDRDTVVADEQALFGTAREGVHCRAEHRQGRLAPTHLAAEQRHIAMPVQPVPVQLLVPGPGRRTPRTIGEDADPIAALPVRAEHLQRIGVAPRLGECRHQECAAQRIRSRSRLPPSWKTRPRRRSRGPHPVIARLAILRSHAPLDHVNGGNSQARLMDHGCRPADGVGQQRREFTAPEVLDQRTAEVEQQDRRAQQTADGSDVVGVCNMGITPR